MKKRLTDADKWEDDWFSELQPKYKLFWQYIIDRCDIAGVWKVNFRLASFHIGDSFDQSETLAQFTSRIEDIGKGKWWVKGFVSFQYPTLNERSPVHRRILQVIDSHGLSNRIGQSIGQSIGNGLPKH